MEVLSSFYSYMPTSNNLSPIIFGCTSFVHIHSDGRSKLDPRALKCVFTWYSLNGNKPWIWIWRHSIKTIHGNWFLYQMEINLLGASGYTPSVSKCSKKTQFFCPPRKTFAYSHEIKCKLHSFFSLFYFLPNQ